MFTPKQEITFLGFVIDSVNMSLSLTSEKKQKIKDLCKSALKVKQILIRDLAKLIGNIVASFPAIQHGELYYRSLEKDKIKALKLNRFDFDKFTSISVKSRQEISWWLTNIDQAFNPVRTPPPDLIIYTDASMTGWGITDKLNPSSGLWGKSDLDHINVLELKAIKFGVQSYCKRDLPVHVRVMCDNTTAISYINNMGGVKSENCNTIAIEIWEFCINKNIWISASHIPGKENTEADILSRKLDDNTEWHLNPKLFLEIFKKFGRPNIDLFATRINKQVEKYVSWHPEPDCYAIDAFSIRWNSYLYYIFPPFSIIGKVVNKILIDNSNVILVVPDWPTQHWYPIVIKMASYQPMIIPLAKSNLVLKHSPAQVHQLYKKLQLLVIKRIPSSSK